MLCFTGFFISERTIVRRNHPWDTWFIIAYLVWISLDLIELDTFSDSFLSDLLYSMIKKNSVVKFEIVNIRLGVKRRKKCRISCFLGLISNTFEIPHMTCRKLSLKIYMGFLLTKICLADGRWQMVAIKLEW